MTTTNPLFDTPWVATERGILTPLDAIRTARSIEWGRGDWDAATFLVLHAMLQTAVALHPERCPTSEDWLELLGAPPADLQDWFAGPEFEGGLTPWQDPTALGEVPAYTLLIDAPGEQTIKQAKDVMVWKEEMPEALHWHEAFIALIADNYWGTSRGQGYYLGCRGEQPCTALVESTQEEASLWTRLWLNVLPAEVWQAAYPTDKPFVLPWLNPRAGQDVTRLDTHPLEMLWQMPRRWRLNVDPDGLVRTAHMQAYGIHYVGSWDHPLTPHRYVERDEEKVWRPAKLEPFPQLDDWYALTVGDGVNQRPAAVVSHCENHYLARFWREKTLRIRCVGWGRFNKSLGAWVESVIPFYGQVRTETVHQAVLTVKAVQTTLSIQLQQLVGGRKHLAAAKNDFMAMITPSFYARLVPTAEDGNPWSTWETFLRRTAQDLVWQVATQYRLDLTKAALAMRNLQSRRPAVVEASIPSA